MILHSVTFLRIFDERRYQRASAFYETLLVPSAPTSQPAPLLRTPSRPGVVPPVLAVDAATGSASPPSRASKERGSGDLVLQRLQTRSRWRARRGCRPFISGMRTSLRAAQRDEMRVGSSPEPPGDARSRFGTAAAAADTVRKSTSRTTNTTPCDGAQLTLRAILANPALWSYHVITRPRAAEPQHHLEDRAQT